MKLFSSPLACSSAAHMILLELGLEHEIEFVDIYSQPHILLNDKTAYALINPKNAVPALLLDSGEILTEIGIILQYLADLRPGSDLLPAAGTLERYRVMEWLSFIGSDIHKTIGPLFNPKMPAAGKVIMMQNLARRLGYVEQCLKNQKYLTGESFTVADAYLFIMTGWEPYFKFDLRPYPNLKAFQQRIASRPSFLRLLEQVQAAVHAMPLPEFPKQS
ncbi:MAG: glutathione transferase GstA [Proteobacteria bacterium]|nr:MAG: glutathione transferase GstA [Pseudomonadota bacterium]